MIPDPNPVFDAMLADGYPNPIAGECRCCKEKACWKTGLCLEHQDVDDEPDEGGEAA